jgi:hypothetical protein
MGLRGQLLEAANEDLRRVEAGGRGGEPVQMSSSRRPFMRSSNLRYKMDSIALNIRVVAETRGIPRLLHEYTQG